MALLGDVTAVLMARDPTRGEGKTRLTAGGGLSPQAAAALAEAMLRCAAHRLAAAAPRLVLAVTPDGCGPALARRLGLGGAAIVDQGPGDLGRRLDRAWRAAGTMRPVALFGADSPDLPRSALRAIPEALRRCDLAVGPTDDGGYWTLAAAAHRPAVLDAIDWGGPDVYDQTLRRAASAGLSVATLPKWRDVDRPGDLEALRARLSAGTDEPALRRLAAELESLSVPTPPCPGSSP